GDDLSGRTRRGDLVEVERCVAARLPRRGINRLVECELEGNLFGNWRRGRRHDFDDVRLVVIGCREDDAERTRQPVTGEIFDVAGDDDAIERVALERESLACGRWRRAHDDGERAV